MKVKLDDQVIFEISELDIQLLSTELFDVEGEIKRRIQWAIEDKCSQCLSRLHQEWKPLFAKEGSDIPADPKMFAQKVFSHPSYKNRKDKERALELEREENKRKAKEQEEALAAAKQAEFDAAVTKAVEALLAEKLNASS